ncbi:cysteine-rich CWC family protein [Bacillus sp. CHD6a]|uniref:cysteine-rich CWC family protein n=1 Tax=Bacillus sp. CHD6a TaxID=1643452 RepID=UPI0009E88681
MDKFSCPICNKDNNCKVDEVNETCWCMSLTIDHKVLDKVPKELLGKQCICEKCFKNSGK